MTIVTPLIILISLLLILVVLVQNSKGGGLSSAFAASNQVMGVRKTTDFLEKATWTLAVLLVVLSLASSAIGNKGTEKVQQSIVKEKSGSAPVNLPSTP